MGWSWYSRVDHGWAMDPSRLAFEHHWMRALSWLQRHLGREISDIFGPHRWQCYQNWAYTIWGNTIGSLACKVCHLNVARNHLRPVQGLEQYRRCTPHQMARWWTNDKVPRNCIILLHPCSRKTWWVCIPGFLQVQGKRTAGLSRIFHGQQINLEQIGNLDAFPRSETTALLRNRSKKLDEGHGKFKMR